MHASERSSKDGKRVVLKRRPLLRWEMSPRLRDDKILSTWIRCVQYFAIGTDASCRCLRSSKRAQKLMLQWHCISPLGTHQLPRKSKIRYSHHSMMIASALMVSQLLKKPQSKKEGSAAQSLLIFLLSTGVKRVYPSFVEAWKNVQTCRRGVQEKGASACILSRNPVSTQRRHSRLRVHPEAKHHRIAVVALRCSHHPPYGLLSCKQAHRKRATKSGNWSGNLCYRGFGSAYRGFGSCLQRRRFLRPRIPKMKLLDARKRKSDVFARRRSPQGKERKRKPLDRHFCLAKIRTSSRNGSCLSQVALLSHPTNHTHQ